MLSVYETESVSVWRNGQTGLCLDESGPDGYMSLDVRTAVVSDADQLAEVAARTFPLACPPSVGTGDIAACITASLSPQCFRTYLADPHRRVLAATESGRVIGYAMMVRGADPDVASYVEPKAVELSKMYVLPDHHGGGVATALMEAGIAWAAEAGARVVWLGVNQNNHRAQSFYRKHGFAVVGTRTFPIGAVLENDFVMVRCG
jgi:ribosomal protein S18 acetylase RimI-like enzyme